MTERQEAILLELLAAGALTPNSLAMRLGFDNAPSKGGGLGSGRGSGAGTAPAQRVIGSLNGLRARGLVGFGRRDDGLAGTAYELTRAGYVEARALRAAGR